MSRKCEEILNHYELEKLYSQWRHTNSPSAKKCHDTFGRNDRFEFLDKGELL